MNDIKNKELDHISVLFDGVSVREQRLVRSYLRQLNTLVLIRHLNPLIIASQQHRGANIALLEGNSSFETKVLALQESINQRISLLGLMNQEYGEIIPAQSWTTIESEWAALLKHWRDDSIITNFELHSHLIEQMIKLMWRLTIQAGYFLCLSPGNNGNQPPHADRCMDQRQLVQIIIADIPNLIETIAKIRGLATHSTVVGHCDSDHNSRLTYLLQSLSYQTERLRTTSRALQHQTLTGLPSLVETLLHEHKLSQLMALVKGEILGRPTIEIESHNVFDFATDIIEVYASVIDKGIDLIRNNVDQALTA